MLLSRIQKALSRSAALALTGLLLLSGCSSQAGTSASTATASPTAGTTAAATTTVSPTKDFVTLSWYMRKPIDNLSDQAAVEAAANAIIKTKINAELKFSLIDAASWDEKMKMMSSAGEAYDLVFTSGWTNSLSLNVQRGALLELDGLLSKYGANVKKGVDPRAWPATTFKGKIMAIPSQSPFTQPSAYVIKKDLAEKYKLDTTKIKSLADLEPFLAQLKANEPNIIPLLVTGKSVAPGTMNYGEIGLSRGISLNEKTGAIRLALEVPENVAMYRLINTYYQKGYIAKDASTKTEFIAEAKSGRYAVMRDSGGFTADGSKSSAQYGFPCVEILDGYPLIQTSSMINACSAISKTSKNPERAMMLLDLIWSDKILLNTLAFGIEGKNYTITAGKGTATPTVKANSGAEQTWAIWHNWLGPLWNSWDSNWNTAAAMDLMQQHNNNAKASVALGFVFNNESVKAEVAQVTAAHGEIDQILNTGIAPDLDKYLAEAIQKLKAAGIDKVRNEVQAQYDAWKASK